MGFEPLRLIPAPIRRRMIRNLSVTARMADLALRDPTLTAEYSPEELARARKNTDADLARLKRLKAIT